MEKNMKCKKGYILRKGYTRKAYTRKNNTKVKSKYIKPNCIKSRGLPGKTTDKFIDKDGTVKGIGKLKKGELGKHGYHKVKTLGVRKRRKALDSAIKEYSPHKILRKLGALRTYQKNTSPENSRIFQDNMIWLRKKYDKDFKGSWESSALYIKSKKSKN